ncbi:hypothetical protein [Collimonas sp.]|uniref:hypothetical protein n=1 Tax=Collimonas sp. TaxID=1963772 RepID=UPI0037BF7A4E
MELHAFIATTLGEIQKGVQLAIDIGASGAVVNESTSISRIQFAIPLVPPITTISK